MMRSMEKKTYPRNQHERDVQMNVEEQIGWQNEPQRQTVFTPVTIHPQRDLEQDIIAENFMSLISTVVKLE
jgi:hypothetical protein